MSVGPLISIILERFSFSTRSDRSIPIVIIDRLNLGIILQVNYSRKSNQQVNIKHPVYLYRIIHFSKMVQHVEESNLDTTILRWCTIAALSLGAILTIFHFYALFREWKRGELNNSSKISFVISVSNLWVLSFRILTSFSCWYSVISWTVFAEIYIISRAINILFFVYRAKCVQGPNPVLSDKWFTKYIPGFVCTFYGISCVVGAYDIPTNPDVVVCVTNQFSYRVAAISMMAWLYFALELAITVVITFLFVVPLWRLYKAGSDSSRDVYNADISQKQRRSRKLLEDALKYGLVLTAVNLLSSNIRVIGDHLYGDNVVAFAYLSLFDPVINMGSTIMLFKENRLLLWKSFDWIRNGIIQMCCFAFVMEIGSESHGPDSRSSEQAQRNAMAIMVLNRQIANINAASNLKIVKESITTFDDDPVDNLYFKDCS